MIISYILLGLMLWVFLGCMILAAADARKALEEKLGIELRAEIACHDMHHKAEAVLRDVLAASRAHCEEYARLWHRDAERVRELEALLSEQQVQWGWNGRLPMTYGFCYFCGQSHEIGHTGTCGFSVLVAASEPPGEEQG